MAFEPSSAATPRPGEELAQEDLSKVSLPQTQRSSQQSASEALSGVALPKAPLGRPERGQPNIDEALAFFKAPEPEKKPETEKKIDDGPAAIPSRLRLGQGGSDVFMMSMGITMQSKTNPPLIIFRSYDKKNIVGTELIGRNFEQAVVSSENAPNEKPLHILKLVGPKRDDGSMHVKTFVFDDQFVVQRKLTSSVEVGKSANPDASFPKEFTLGEGSGLAQANVIEKGVTFHPETGQLAFRNLDGKRQELELPRGGKVVAAAATANGFLMQIRNADNETLKTIEVKNNGQAVDKTPKAGE